MAEKDFELISDEISVQIVDAARNIVTSEGTDGVNVRRILKTLDITNRVFYNRFHNIGEVLQIISNETTMQIRASLKFSFDKDRDYFEQVTEVADKVLVLTYETRMKFAHYVFHSDSVSNVNYNWWTDEIVKILNYGINNNYIKKVNTEKASYAIWCFIKGFCADAVGRNLPLDEAMEKYRYGFKFILDGLRA